MLSFSRGTKSTAAGNSSATPKSSSHGRSDRQLIRLQMFLGVGLVVFGSLLLVIFHQVGLFSPDDGHADPGSVALIVGVATGVLGVGAALIPATAAGAASARILGQLPDNTNPVKVGQPTIDQQLVTTSILTTDRVVGAYVRDVSSNKTLTDITYVVPRPDIQMVSFTLPAALTKGTTICVVVNDNGATVSGPTAVQA